MKRVMKLLLVKSFHRPTSVGLLALELHRLGHEVHLLLPGESAESAHLATCGIKVHVLDWVRHSEALVPRVRASVKLIAGMAKLFRRHEFDIIHLNLASARLYGRISSLFGGRAKIVSSIRGIDSRYEAISNWIDERTVAVSKAVESYLADSGIPTDKLVTIPNGVALNEVVSAGSDERVLHRELGFDPGVRLVGMIAFFRSHASKGHKLLADAAARICGEFDDVRFVFIGGDLASSGYNQAYFRAYVRTLGLEGRFVFLGNRDDVAHIVPSLYAHVLPSFSEGCPMAVLESMAAGVPNIASRIDAVREIIDDGHDGLLFDTGDSAALADRLRHLLREPGLAARLGAAGRETVARRYSARLMGERYEALFRNVARAPARRRIRPRRSGARVEDRSLHAEHSNG